MATEHVARLRELLAEAEAAEAAAREEQKAATPVRWQYTIKPTKANWHRVYDPTCRLYDISGRVTNRDVAKEVGHPDHAMREGSMTYVYNNATGHIIMSVGGGTAYIFEDFHVDTDSYNVDVTANAFAEIDDFLVENPEGGDITDIVQRHQRTRWNRRNKS